MGRWFSQLKVYCLKTCMIENINLLEYLTSDTYDIERTLCCNYLSVCLFMLPFFQSKVSCLQRHGRVTGPGDVSRRKLRVHPSVLLITSVCLSFWRSTVPSGLTMPTAGRLSALLLAWILCALTGSSEAQTPAPESRKSLCYLLHKNSTTSFCPLRLMSGGGHMTRKMYLYIIPPSTFTISIVLR